MFETLFQYPAIVARHRGGPFTEARERFLNFRASQGLARTTLQRYAQELLVVAERIDITSDSAIGSSTIEAAADRWAREQQHRQRVHGPRWSRKLFVQTATDWLCFLGHLEGPIAKIVPFADRIADFAAYRRDERGLSPATIRNQSWHVEKFLGWLADQNRTFADITLEDVDRSEFAYHAAGHTLYAMPVLAAWCRRGFRSRRLVIISGIAVLTPLVSAPKWIWPDYGK
jgi:integrase/recombinase XerD